MEVCCPLICARGQEEQANDAAPREPVCLLLLSHFHLTTSVPRLFHGLAVHSPDRGSKNSASTNLLHCAKRVRRFSIASAPSRFGFLAGDSPLPPVHHSSGLIILLVALRVGKDSAAAASLDRRRVDACAPSCAIAMSEGEVRVTQSAGSLAYLRSSPRGSQPRRVSHYFTAYDPFPPHSQNASLASRFDS